MYLLRQTAMMKLSRKILVIGLFLALSEELAANHSEAGLISVYADHLIGRPTASGEIYDGRALTAAHASLPIGSMIRVAHFGTGKMVDVRVNDRKAKDSTIVHISHSAGQMLGIRSGQGVQGSILLVGAAPSPSSTQPSSTTPFSAPAAGAPVAAAPSGTGVIPPPETAPVGRRLFRPFSKMQEDAALRKAVNNPNAVVSVPQPHYSIPQAPVAPSPVAPPQQVEEKGGLFSGLFQGKKSNPYAQAPSPLPPGGVAPAGAPPGSLLPMSAPGPARIPPPAPTRSVAPVPQPSATPAGGVPAGGASQVPYRVQFGAFRKQANADEMAVMLNQAGIPTMVAPARGRDLHLVLTHRGFATAEQAQGWINYEGARRGWRERPVVIR